MPTFSTRRLVAVVGGFLGVLAWWWVVAAPQWRAVATMHPTIGTLRRQIHQVREGMVRRPSVQAKIKALEAEWQASPRPLARERLPAILDEMARLAKAQVVMVEAVRPLPPLPSLAKPSADAPGAEQEALVIPLEILGRAGYHDIGRFLEALEQSALVMRLQSLVIEADRRDPERHGMTVRVQVYLAVTSL